MTRIHQDQSDEVSAAHSTTKGEDSSGSSDEITSPLQEISAGSQDSSGSLRRDEDHQNLQDD
jgi:hypothetical protein